MADDRPNATGGEELGATEVRSLGDRMIKERKRIGLHVVEIDMTFAEAL